MQVFIVFELQDLNFASANFISKYINIVRITNFCLQGLVLKSEIKATIILDK